MKEVTWLMAIDDGLAGGFLQHNQLTREFGTHKVPEGTIDAGPSASAWHLSSAPASPPRLPLKVELVMKTVFSCWSAYAEHAMAVSSATAEIMVKRQCQGKANRSAHPIIGRSQAAI